MSKSFLVVSALLVVSGLILAACGGPVPTPSPAPPAQPQAQPTQPPVKETVIVKETVPVKETVIVQPTTIPTATPTATPTAKPTTAPVKVATAKPPAQGGKLEFTLDDIEYAASKRKGDNKIQLTITLRPRGGVPPYYFVLDPGAVETKVNGLTFTFDWHNCGPSEPHSIVLYSADGQKVGPLSFLYDYKCE